MMSFLFRLPFPLQFTGQIYILSVALLFI
uniref:Uncharacterized protein n=1 Tax=Anguilla anguilla TaxID=7936 RepID=A0A0E9WCM8_ANGAN